MKPATDKLLNHFEKIHVVRDRLQDPNFRIASIGLFFYVSPSLAIVILETHFTRPNQVLLSILTLISLCGIIIFVLFTYDFDYDTFPKPSLLDEIGKHDRESLLVEYQELGEEFRRKDMLMTRSMYLSLVISGVLLTILVRDTVWKPFIAMAGSIIAFIFVVSITSQMASRAQIRDRRIDIEMMDEFNGRLAVSQSGRIREPRPKFTNFSASRLILLFHQSTVFLWVLLYLYLLLTF